MLIYQAVVTALLAARLLNTLNNLRLIRRLHPRPHPASGPLVSILVPARNEARTIARCVISLVRQDYPCCEVLVMGRRWPLVAGALGKFLLFRRETYLRIGGHEAVRTDIVEDMQLSRLVKRHGGRLMWCDGTALARARPYHGLGEAWRGIAKSSFAAIDYSLAALVLGIPAVAAVLLAPYGFAVAGIIGRRMEVALLWLPLAQVALLWVSYLLILWRFRLPRRTVILHAATILATMLLTMQSAYQVLLGDRVAWKGRTYRFNSTRRQAGQRTGQRWGVVVELAAARLVIVALLLPLGYHWAGTGAGPD